MEKRLVSWWGRSKRHGATLRRKEMLLLGASGRKILDWRTEKLSTHRTRDIKEKQHSRDGQQEKVHFAANNGVSRQARGGTIKHRYKRASVALSSVKP